MTLRRYSDMHRSVGTRIPTAVRQEVLRRDGICVFTRLGIEHVCDTFRELDHVRASHGMGMKSESSADNLVLLCGAAHRIKTEYGKTYRPVLLSYLASFEEGAA